jgi:hypothetical protein
MKITSSEFEIKELEETYLDCNKTVTKLRRRRVGFYSELYSLVSKICQKQNDELLVTI